MLIWCLVVLGGVGCLGLGGILVMVGAFRGVGGRAASASGSSAQEPKPRPGSQWTYDGYVDGMGRGVLFASVTSTNLLSFNFPYEGAQSGTLVVRRHPTQRGADVLVSIEQGQFLCGASGCTVNVRFDSGPIQPFPASEPGDGSTTTLFLRNEARFIMELRKAKVARVEATFYQEGTQALEFNVEGFNW